MNLRDFDYEQDFEKVFKIWQEVGWLTKSKRNKEALKYFVQASKGKVALLNNQVEGYINSTPGLYQYRNKELKLQTITAVTISRVARKQSLATKTTAKAIAEAAAKGTHISALSMFEQGFYDKLGYGTGSYENLISFDPDHLSIKGESKPPIRIDENDYKEVHQAKLNRKKRHGFCTLFPEKITKGEMLFGEKKPFGLGYKDKNGKIDHHLLIYPNQESHGPYFIRWMVFNNVNQFFDLMNLIKSLGDQIHLVRLWEPAGIPFQNLIKKPYKASKVTEKSKFEVTNKAYALWQVRILNLKDCIKNTTFDTNKLNFNLKLEDPIEKYLDNNSSWQGLSGEYTVSLGKDSRLKKGLNSNLSTLKTNINTFTKMWIGAVRPTLLPYTNYFDAPDSLIEKLDNLFITLPQPRVDWNF